MIYKRWVIRIALFSLLAVMSAAVSSALAAANTVPVTHTGDKTYPVDRSQLFPPQCAGMTFTTVIYGSGVIDAGPGNNLIFGSDGPDTIRAGNGDDCVIGGGGDDIIKGMNGNDVLDGGPGNDTIDGGPGTDKCLNGEKISSCES